jgi:hypothetical protein
MVGNSTPFYAYKVAKLTVHHDDGCLASPTIPLLVASSFSLKHSAQDFMGKMYLDKTLKPTVHARSDAGMPSIRS